MTKRTLPVAFLMITLIVLSGCSAAGAASGTPAQGPVAEASAAPSSNVVAEAKVAPALSAALSLPAGGIVSEILVAEGQQVETGAVILRVDARRQAAAVAQAQASLARAEATLAELKAGTRSEEIEGAEAAVEAAEAQLARLEQGATAEELARADAVIATARAELRQVQEGASADARTAAAADLGNAEAAVKQAQAAYDRVAGVEDIAARPESLKLEQATNALEAARARYDETMRGGAQAAIDAARGRLAQAEAQRAALSAPARPADLAAAKAEIRGRNAQLDQLKAGARPERISAAEADVASARAALEQAQAALSETELRAPFSGTIAALNVKAGEYRGPGVSVAQLAGLDRWVVETTDLTEIEIVRVREGQAVTIVVDAIPDLELAGEVVAISAVGETRQGDNVYKVTVQPAEQDARLRWNMAAAVTFVEG